jgi:hypothetical protein
VRTKKRGKMGSGKVIKGGYSMYPPSPTSPTRSHFTAKVKLTPFTLRDAE